MEIEQWDCLNGGILITTNLAGRAAHFTTLGFRVHNPFYCYAYRAGNIAPPTVTELFVINFRVMFY